MYRGMTEEMFRRCKQGIFFPRFKQASKLCSILCERKNLNELSALADCHEPLRSHCKIQKFKFLIGFVILIC